MANKPVIDIIIPSYNGRDLLEKNLPKVIKLSPEVGKIIVVDDGGTDDTGELLREKFPGVIYLKHNKNLGFSKSVNEGVRYSKADLIILLNNDVYPETGYLKNILKYFDNQKVFAVSFNEEHSSWPEVSWHSGKFQFLRGADKTKPYFSAWMSGGSSIIRRVIWNKLNGFNEIYSPAYWEDIDLGWRAWKSGYEVVWAPEPKVVHHHESTFGLMDQNFMNLIKQRNELLFTRLNITDPDLITSHRKFLLSHTLKHPGYLKVILAALLRLPFNRQKNEFVRTDKEVLALVNQKYE